MINMEQPDLHKDSVETHSSVTPTKNEENQNDSAWHNMEESLREQVRTVDEKVNQETLRKEEMEKIKSMSPDEKQNAYREKIKSIDMRWEATYYFDRKQGYYEVFGQSGDPSINEDGFRKCGVTMDLCIKLLNNASESLSKVNASDVLQAIQDIDEIKEKYHWHDNELFFRLNQLREDLVFTADCL